jgi:hypothetical protein
MKFFLCKRNWMLLLRLSTNYFPVRNRSDCTKAFEIPGKRKGAPEECKRRVACAEKSFWPLKNMENGGGGLPIPSGPRIWWVNPIKLLAPLQHMAPLLWRNGCLTSPWRLSHLLDPRYYNAQTSKDFCARSVS